MSTDFTRDTDTSSCTFPNRREEVVKNYNLRDSYRIVSWVYACINAIADAIAGVPLKFYTTAEGENRTEVPEGHPIHKLFSPPKPGETPTLEDYIRQVYINLGIFGEIFSPLEFDGALPANIPVRNPYLFEAELDKKGDIKLWKMEKYSNQGGASGVKVNIPPEKLIHYKYYDPYNRHRGLSPLYAGRLPIQQDINMSVWNAGFFQGGLRNPIVILLKHMLGSGPTRNNYLEGISRQFTGFVKGQGPLVVDGGADVRPLLSSIKDLDFIEGKSLTREEICALYGVPPAQVGIFRYANYANSREQTRLFWVNTLIPKMRVLKNTLQVGLLDVYWPGLYIDWDWESVEAIREDPVSEATAESLKSSAARNYWDMGYEKGDIATILDDPDLDAEDRVDADEGDDGGDGDDGPPPEEPVEESIVTIRDNHITLGYNSRALHQYAQGYQKHILSTYSRQYMAFLKTFTNKVIEEAVDGEELDQPKWQKRWVETIRPLMRDIYYDGARQALKEIVHPSRVARSFQLEGQFGMVEFMRGEKAMESIDFFSRSTSAKSYAITGTVQGYLRSPAVNILSDAPEAVILPMMNIEEAYWAISRIYHHGRMIAQDVLKVDTHAWAAFRCPITEHNDMTGTTVARWGAFNKGMIHPNADVTSAPVKACTCTTFPVEFAKYAQEEE
jgi:HK97 family phage portal protein